MNSAWQESISMFIPRERGRRGRCPSTQSLGVRSGCDSGLLDRRCALREDQRRTRRRARVHLDAAELALGRHRRGRAGGGGVRCCRDRSLDLLLQEAIVGCGDFRGDRARVCESVSTRVGTRFGRCGHRDALVGARPVAASGRVRLRAPSLPAPYATLRASSGGTPREVGKYRSEVLDEAHKAKLEAEREVLRRGTRFSRFFHAGSTPRSFLPTPQTTSSCLVSFGLRSCSASSFRFTPVATATVPTYAPHLFR